jgi:hypothetical protein
MASKWIAEKKYKAINTISAGVVRCLWLIRNDLIFVDRNSQTSSWYSEGCGAS